MGNETRSGGTVTGTLENGGNKPGWQTSEWWTTIVVVLTALLAGVGALGLPDTHPVVKAAAFVGAALAALGYTFARTLAKKNGT